MEANLADNFQTPVREESESEPQPIRMGMIGCGYVTTMSHLPASQLVRDVQVAALVDPRLDLARSLAENYHIPLFASDYTELFGQVDAVMVAVPHHLHTPIALDCLRQGIHVLVEKPMATSTAECHQLIQAAQSSGAKLAVGLTRRFFDSNRLVKQIIDSGFLGKVERFEAREAVLFDRFKASPFTVLPPSGGILWDTGPHTLDLLLWWLGDFDRIRYWDDARGGVEANCRIEIRTTGGVEGMVELSRTRGLENKIWIECEAGRIEVDTLNPAHIQVDSELFSGPINISRVKDDSEIGLLVPYFARQLANFVAAILGDEDLSIPGTEGVRGIEVIERCRQSRQPLEEAPWEKLNQNVIRRLAI